MVVDPGEPEIGERQPPQARHRVVGRDDVRPDVVEQLAEGGLVHVAPLSCPGMDTPATRPKSPASGSEPGSIAFLGPAGTFTEEALLTQPDYAGRNVLPLSTITDVLDAVSTGEVDSASCRSRTPSRAP